MNSIETWAAFFGWCTVINFGLYLLTIGALVGLRGFVFKFNAKLFGVAQEDIARESFGYVGRYKLLITVFFFVPYVAIKLIQTCGS